MNHFGIPVARRRRSATGRACDERAAGMAVVDRRHADSVGQSGRRQTVRRRQWRRACRKDFRTGRSAPPPGGAAREPAAARTARSGWSGCAVLARRSAGSSPAAARGSISPTAAMASWSPPPRPVGRAMPLVERLQRLVEGIDTPIAAFARDGMFDRRQRCRAHAARLSRSLGGRPRRGAQRRAEAGPRRNAGRHRPPGAAARRQRRRYRPGRADRAGATAAARRTQCRPSLAASRRNEPAQVTLVDEFDRSSRDDGRSPGRVSADRRSAPSCRRRQPAEFAPMRRSRGRHAVAEQPAEAVAGRSSPHEPSPYVEAVADEPAPRDRAAPNRAAGRARRHGSTSRRRAPLPLRFMWQMDADGRFSLGSDEFTRLIGAAPQPASAGRGATSPKLSGSIRMAACSRRSPPTTPGAASP